MRMYRTPALALIALCVGAALWFAYTKYTSFRPWAVTEGGVHSGLGSEILVMRTPGGLLEVSTINANEQFDKKFVYSVFGVQVGETVPHIRIPAVYRYHIELAPEWKIVRTDEVFMVVTPRVNTRLPVAVDIAKMEKDVGGGWALVPFNEAEDMDALQREITRKLAEKAASPVYLQLQREAARKTVTEFVKKWLVMQEPWKAAQQPRIEVLFAD